MLICDSVATSLLLVEMSILLINCYARRIVMLRRCLIAIGIFVNCL
jgi:hypothetical protein